jgi:hypothetical protein
LVDTLSLTAGIQFVPVDALILGAAFNDVDSEIDSDLIIQDPFDLDNPATNVRGQPLPRSPEFKGSLTADYTFDQVFGNSSVVVGGVLNYYVQRPSFQNAFTPNGRHSRPPKACLESSCIFRSAWIPELASQLWNGGEKSQLCNDGEKSQRRNDGGISQLWNDGEKSRPWNHGEKSQRRKDVFLRPHGAPQRPLGYSGAMSRQKNNRVG